MIRELEEELRTEEEKLTQKKMRLKALQEAYEL
jgi:hypothetical protein